MRLFSDYRSFKRQLRQAEGTEIVLLNPSFGYKSLLRDALFLRASKRAGKRTVVFFRGWEAKCERAVRRRFARAFRFAYARADLVLVLATEFERALRDLAYRGPIVVETTAVADGDFEPPNSERAPSKTVELLFLARVERNKGVYRAIEAFELLRKAGADVALTIAGDGTELERARQYVVERAITGVRFPGYVRDAEKLAVFRQADVFLFPSSHGEGMPNSVLEAMAHGLPVVAAAVGGLRDFFEDGKMGFLCDSEEPARIAEAVQRIVADPALCSAIGTFNRDYADRRFRASRVAGRLLAALDGRDRLAE